MTWPDAYTEPTSTLSALDRADAWGSRVAVAVTVITVTRYGTWP